MMLIRTIAVACALLVLAAPVFAATASGVVPPAGSAGRASDAYRLDPDPAARYIPLPITMPEHTAQTRRLRDVERLLKRHPDHPMLLRERAYIRSKRGEIDAAEADFARALQVAGDDVFLRRHVLWSQGWARFDAGQDESALRVWREAVDLHGGNPFWWPYTAALAEWRLGRHAEAVALFDRAVQGMPALGTERGFTERTARWPEHQFAVASTVFTAWKASKAATAAAEAPAAP
jgi:tetratricopeptide (TPR) repeat protein